MDLLFLSRAHRTHLSFFAWHYLIGRLSTYFPPYRNDQQYMYALHGSSAALQSAMQSLIEPDPVILQPSRTLDCIDCENVNVVPVCAVIA